MTNDSTRNRLSAVFFAFIMVTSMVAMSAAFAGTAAADSISSGNDSVTQGANGQALGTVNIVEGSAGDFSASGSAKIETPSGVTFNQSSTSLTASSTNGTVSNLRVADQSTIRFDYEGFNTSAPTSIDIAGIVIDVGTDATTADLSNTIGVNSSAVAVTVESATLTTNRTVSVSPGGTSGAVSLNVTDNATNSQAIQNGSTVQISIPSSASGLTFDQSQPLNLNQFNETVADNARYVDSRTVAIDIAETDGAPSPDRANVTVRFNATRDAANTTAVNLELDATPQDGTGTVTTQSSSGVIGVDSPVLTVNNNTDLTLANDRDGETGVTFANNKTNISIDTGGNARNVTLTIPSDAAFTFDTSDGPNTFANASGAVYVNERTLNITTTGTNNKVNVSIDQLEYNLTAGGESSSRLQFAVNSSGPLGQSQNFINVTQVAGDTIQGDADINSGGIAPVNNPSNSSRAGTTLTAQVNVSNASATGNNTLNNLGGESVSLAVTDSPSGDTATLNTSSVTTNESGIARFNVTLGSVGGTYNVTASTAADSNVNVTFSYTATSGAITQFNATGQENALIDTTDLSTTPNQTTSQGVYQVRLEDANGNVNSTAADGTEVNFRLSLSDSAAGVQNVTTALASDGTAAGNATTESSGVYTYNYTEDTSSKGIFYVFVNDPTPGDTDLTVQEGGTSDTGTITFFDTVSSVDVALNTTSATVGDTVEVSATPLTSDGTTIAVANISTSVTVNNTTVATPSPQNIATAADGAATTTISADQNGTTFVNATISGQTGSTELSVGAASAPSPVVGNNTPTDIDGDGTFEDANGDGSFDIVDVQAVFDNRDSSAVQNNTAAYDYNGDGEFTIVDVNRLFQDSQA